MIIVVNICFIEGFLMNLKKFKIFLMSVAFGMSFLFNVAWSVKSIYITEDFVSLKNTPALRSLPTNCWIIELIDLIDNLVVNDESNKNKLVKILNTMNTIQPYELLNFEKIMPVLLAGTVLAVLDADTVDRASYYLNGALGHFLESRADLECTETFYFTFKETLSTKFKEANNS